MRITTPSLAAVIIAASLSVPLLAGAKDGRYWEWGWGNYGRGTELDVARYDWSLINFGNVPADQTTIDRCNRILTFNPQHKFVIRVWPVMGLGDCPENRFQMSLFHYYYKEGAKAKVHENTRAQIDLIRKGVTDPGSVVGSCFLEELPSMVNGIPRPGGPAPWDIKRFEKEVTAELGAPFDTSKEEHLLWWGRKYCQMLADLHATMKQASGGQLVIYYQATQWYTLDHLPAGESCLNPKLSCLPFRYADILKEGLCDGIFGYPNNSTIWQNQTVQVVQKLNCLFFSQTSVPGFMRLCHFDEALDMARWQNPGNLGTFIYVETVGRGRKAWNEMPYVDGTRYWTITDHYRRVGWQCNIGMDIVRRGLQPRVLLDYNLGGRKQGSFLHVWAQVYNPRHPSWFGDDTKDAMLTNAEVALDVPNGFSIPLQNNAGPRLRLGDIGPMDCKVGDWWVYIDGDGTIPAGQAFAATVSADGGKMRVRTSSSQTDTAIATLEPRQIVRTGDTWIEPAYREPISRPAVEIRALAPEIVFPELAVGDRRVLYRGVLKAGTRLVIGPGVQAVLFDAPLFTDETRSLAAPAAGKSEATFSDGYLVWSTPAVPVEPGQPYVVSVTGRTENGGNCLVIAHFSGTLEGKAGQTQDVVCFANQFGKDETSLEKEIAAPGFEAGTARMTLRFYRFKSAGTVVYKRFDVRAPDFNPGGTDVSSRIEGMLPPLEQPYTRWTYRDLSDPAEDTPKLTLQFRNPDAAPATPGTGKPERVGGEF